MSLIKCRRCGIDDEVNKCELHHLVPKFMGGVDLDGRRYLCKKHHNILHLMIPCWLWEFIPEGNHNLVREEIKKRTLKWCKTK